ncbi:hypothetical protein T484DRAFT_3341693 [Baffinella frigidus]|nr:hypothetical protein T484DRAFT_3341693 [Cryptophyta sp. CCMP2293]
MLHRSPACQRRPSRGGRRWRRRTIVALQRSPPLQPAALTPSGQVDALEGKAQMLASAPVTSLEGEEAVADVDENAAIKLELDELKAKAMGAMEDLPEGVSPVVRGIVAQDYDSVVTYLDQVAADATGIQHGAALPTPAVDPLAIDAVAIAGKPVSLKSLKEVRGGELHVPRKELVLALTNAVSAPLDGYRRWKSAHPNDPEEVSTQKVMAAMSLAKDMCAEILSDPHAAQVAATAQVEDMSRWQELVQEQPPGPRREAGAPLCVERVRPTGVERAEVEPFRLRVPRVGCEARFTRGAGPGVGCESGGGVNSVSGNSTLRGVRAPTPF